MLFQLTVTTKNGPLLVQITRATTFVVTHVISALFEDVNGERAVVSKDTDTGLYLNAHQHQILMSLHAGVSLGEALRSTRMRLDAVEQLLTDFLAVGFIQRIDSIVVENPHAKIKPMLSGVPQRVFTWLLSPIFLVFCFIYCITGLAISLSVLDYLPSFSTFFWHQDIFVVFLSIFLISNILLLLHELAHFVFTKAAGGEARIHLSYLYVYFVAETDEYFLSLVPKYKRYFVYLSGMLVECMIVTTLLWVLFLSDYFHIDLGFLSHIFSLTILISFLGIVWQFGIFIETDLYNFFSDYLDWPDLNRDSRKFILRTVVKKSHGLLRQLLMRVARYFKVVSFLKTGWSVGTLSRRRRGQLVLYSILMIIGLPVSLLTYLYFTVFRDFTLVTISLSYLVFSFNAHNYGDVVKMGFVTFFLTYTYFIYIFLFFLSLGRHNE
jgi:hypothetical protein